MQASFLIVNRGQQLVKNEANKLLGVCLIAYCVGSLRRK